MLVHAVPEWRGAVVARAGGLPDGCLALAALAAEVAGVGSPRVVPVPDESSPVANDPRAVANDPRAVANGPRAVAGPSVVTAAGVGRRAADSGGVANRGVLLAGRPAQLAALEAPGGPVLTIGGDCAVDLVPLGVARYRHGAGLAAVWFDAHADLNTAASSPSGALHGMVLRAAFGDGDPDFAANPALTRGNAVLVGTRAVDPGEAAAIADGLVTSLPPARGRDPEAVVAAVLATGADRVHLHVDLDVLDPAEFPGVTCPEPGGLSVAEVVAGIRAVAGVLPVVGATVTECVTTDPTELRALVPLLLAVTQALSG